MKRLFSILIVLSALCTGAQAQGFIVKGGASIDGRYDGWLAGIGYQTFSKDGFSVQPELIYKSVTNLKVIPESSTRTYLDLPVNLQYGVDLLVAKPFLIVSPFVGYRLSGYEQDNDTRLDYGCGTGLGINFWYLQLDAKYNWSFSNPTRKAFWEFTLGVRF